MADPKQTAPKEAKSDAKPETKTGASASAKTETPPAAQANPALEADVGRKEFVLASNVRADGERAKAGNTVLLKRDQHAELLALGAVTAPWPETDEDKTTD
ncbi:unnamed protein product [Effrenium voratum]|uniref:Uncharacterized protein n=1 Tax=Effrenium voratum TaxID=2562239 RepID=A0AA36N218_9DINO|nr:unnamed protein product [Effrenium voratum]